MKERDYILVSVLTKLRIGRHIIADTTPHIYDEKYEEPWRDVLIKLTRIIEELEKKIKC